MTNSGTNFLTPFSFSFSEGSIFSFYLDGNMFVKNLKMNAIVPHTFTHAGNVQKNETCAI